MRNFPDRVVEKIKTHLIFNKFFNHAIYEIMSKSTVDPYRPQIRQCGACALHAGYLRLQIHTQIM